MEKFSEGNIGFAFLIDHRRSPKLTETIGYLIL